jgi:L-threonylcarbamoyladenylate synthase
MVETRIIAEGDPDAVATAAEVLRRGGLVALPTDTVYGLAADVWNPEAVARLFAVKGRPELKAIPVLLSDAGDLMRVARPQSELVMELARVFWPGPLTLVLRRLPGIPSQVSLDDTLGVRVPDHSVAQELLAETGPLAVTSANRSAGPNTLEADAVREALGGRIELILDGGRTPGGVPSTVVDCTSDSLQVLREGPIELAEIERSIQRFRASEHRRQSSRA